MFPSTSQVSRKLLLDSGIPHEIVYTPDPKLSPLLLEEANRLWVQAMERYTTWVFIGTGNGTLSPGIPT